MKTVKLALASLSAIFLLLLALATAPTLVVLPFQFVYYLCLGWLHFLVRVAPHVRPDFSAIIFATLVSLLIVSGTQWLGHALFRPASCTRWPLRWSLCLYAGLWLLFLTAMGVTGAVHQAVWLGKLDRPWLVEYQTRWARQHALQIAGEGMRAIGTDHDWKLSEMHSAMTPYFAKRRPWRGSSVLEDYAVALYPADNGELRAALVIPRSDEKLREVGFARVTRGETTNLAAEKLDEALRELNQ